MNEPKKPYEPKYIRPEYLHKQNHGRYARSSPDHVCNIPIAVFYSMMMRGEKACYYNNKRIDIVDRFAVITEADKPQQTYQITASNLLGKEMLAKVRKNRPRYTAETLHAEVEANKVSMVRLEGEALLSFQLEYGEELETEHSYKEYCVVIPEGYLNDYDWG